MEPRVAYRHPILDKKFNVTSDAQVFTDSEIEELIQCYIRAARVAWEAGADFVDIKHCHGYLLHEFLSAFIRPGKYGGSFENRTRILRDIIAGIRASGNRDRNRSAIERLRLGSVQAGPGIVAAGEAWPGNSGRRLRTACPIATVSEWIRTTRWNMI